MTKYAYELHFGDGRIMFSTQDTKFAEQEMLQVCKTTKGLEKVKKVKFLMEIPNGYHICGCGNLAHGIKDELCDECKALYGHTYEHEL